MIKQFINKTREDTILIIAFVLAVITSFIHAPKLHYIDFKVLTALFNLMIVVEAFKKMRLLEMVSVKMLDRFSNERKVALVIIVITFLFAMLVTNDVALITFVPLTLIISKKAEINPTIIIILQTLAANIGSSLTPMGNPQNLYLYYRYNIGLNEFIKIMLPFVAAGFIFLIIALKYLVSSRNIDFDMEEVKVKDKKKAAVFITLFAVVALSIFNVINHHIAFWATVITTLILDKKLFKNVDYQLLLTFVFFFIFIGNLSHFEEVKNIFARFLYNDKATFISAIAFSQFLSNVPCAILLSGFTGNYKELLLGVNIGGMGTIIASLASVISYKFYINEYKEHKRKYLLKFSFYNFAALIIFTLPFLFLIK